MGTIIPIEVSNIVLRMQERFVSPPMYYAGGCTQDRPAVDYDVLVMDLNTGTKEVIQEQMETIFPGKTICYPVYEDEYNNPYKIIVTVKVNDTKVDFLFVRNDMDIYDTLDRFPLSIQMKALDIKQDRLVYGYNYQKDPIVVFDGGGTAEDKYRKYYPDTLFVNPSGTKRRAQDDYPF